MYALLSQPAASIPSVNRKFVRRKRKAYKSPMPSHASGC